MRYLSLIAVIAASLWINLPQALFANGSSEAGSKGQVLQFALSGSPDTLDPQKTSGTLTFQVDRSIYDTLVEPDATGRLVPALAESWEISPDNLTWTFHLRHGVLFHNGDLFTSRDVKATLDRVRDPAIASPNASEFSAISAIDTPDDYTVVLHLSEPFAPLLASLASGWGAILPASLIAAGHDFDNKPVGTGPFMLSQWVRDNRIVLKKNPDYWMSGHPMIDGVDFNIITEHAVQLQGLLSGQIDIDYLLNKEDLPQVEQNPNTSYKSVLTALVCVLAMNNSRPPFDNLKVRQAINYAIDKKAALDAAYGGGKVVGTFMDYSDPYYVDYTDLYPYNPDKARELLASSGADLSRPLDLALPQNYEPHVKAGEIYQQMLSKVGLNVKIRLVDWSTWLGSVYKGGNYDMTVIGHTGKLDPNGRLANFGTGNSYVHWKNQKAAELIAQGRRTVGFDKRKPIYDQVLKIMAEQVPMVFVGTPYRYIGMRKNVTGFRIDPRLDTFDFRYTELK
ncbi:ABC transporter substrate-binding protein [Salinispira pacifica]